MPLISVFLTSYNHAQYLQESIESVLNQTFQDFELIIVDDCSSDNSWDIIQPYSEYANVTIARPTQNTRGYFYLDFLRKSKGKYIAMHHSDDVWEPAKLEKQVALLEAHPEYAACFTQVKFIDEDSNHYDLPEGHFYKDVFDKENRSKEEWLNHFFYQLNCLCHPSILIRKEMYEKYGLLDTVGLSQVPDFLMWVKLCLHEEIFIYQEKLTKFRLRRGNQENTSADKSETQVRSQIETFFLLREYLKIENKEMFLKVFPQAIIYFCQGKINLEFALAKLCLSCANPIFWLFGIERLFYLINNKDTAEEIELLYQYSYKNFFFDSAKYDIFGIKQKLQFLEASIFVDYGEGFNEKDRLKKRLYLPQSGQLYFECTVQGRNLSGQTIKGLRFDPNEGELIKVSFFNFSINGKEVSNRFANNIISDGKYDVFISGDPRYIIDIESEVDIEVRIVGEVKFLNYDERENLINGIIVERNDLAIERNALSAHLCNIKSSRGYRLLQKCYCARDYLLKLFKGK